MAILAGKALVLVLDATGCNEVDAALEICVGLFFLRFGAGRGCVEQSGLISLWICLVTFPEVFVLYSCCLV